MVHEFGKAEGPVPVRWGLGSPLPLFSGRPPGQGHPTFPSRCRSARILLHSHSEGLIRLRPSQKLGDVAFRTKCIAEIHLRH